MTQFMEQFEQRRQQRKRQQRIHRKHLVQTAGQRELGLGGHDAAEQHQASQHQRPRPAVGQRGDPSQPWLIRGDLQQRQAEEQGIESRPATFVCGRPCGIDLRQHRPDRRCVQRLRSLPRLQSIACQQELLGLTRRHIHGLIGRRVPQQVAMPPGIRRQAKRGLG